MHKARKSNYISKESRKFNKFDHEMLGTRSELMVFKFNFIENLGEYIMRHARRDE